MQQWSLTKEMKANKISVILTLVAAAFFATGAVITVYGEDNVAVSKGILPKPKIITPAEIEAFNAKREQNQELTKQLSKILQCGPEETMCSLIFIGMLYYILF